MKNILAQIIRLATLITLIGAYSSRACSGFDASLAASPINQHINQKTIVHILSSKRGDLWYTTFDGIHRYDGRKVSSYSPNKRGIGSTPSSDVTRIIESKDGSLYFTTEEAGLLLYNPEKDKLEVYGGTPASLSSRIAISSAAIDNGGHIWLGSRSGSIVKLDPSKDSYATFNLASSDRISDLTVLTDGSILAANETGEIFKKTPHDETFRQLVIPAECSADPLQIEEILTPNSSQIILGTRNQGVIIFNTERSSCDHLLLPKRSKTDSLSTSVHDLFYETSTATIWIASNRGLFAVKPNRDVYHFHSENSRIGNDVVYGVSPNLQGLIWIATYAGLYTLIETPFELFDSKTDSRVQDIIDFQNAGNDNIWVATYQGLLLLDGESGALSSSEDIIGPVNLAQSGIMSFSASADQLWMGYRSEGAMRYSFQRDPPQQFSRTSSEQLTSNGVVTILQTIGGATLLGTNDGGLNVVEADGKVRTYSNISTGNPLIYDLFESRDSLIWVASESGLYTFDIPSGEFTNIEVKGQEASQGTNPQFWEIAEATDGTLWIGTQLHGLYRVKPSVGGSSRVAEHYPVNAAADSLVIYAIELDDRGKLWMSTNNGLTRVDPESNTFSHFSRNQGLQDTDFEKGASFRDSRGRLYFGGANGFNRFHPDEVNFDFKPAEVVLTDIKVGNRSVAPPMLVRTLQGIELGHRDYHVQFSFSVLDFLDPLSNRYRYKLHNFDPQWIENGNSNSATYTNLPPGRYSLQVQGANSAGTWNREGVSLSVKVLPALWESWWAYCIYALLAVVAGWFSLKYRDNLIRRREATRQTDIMTDTADRAMDDLQENLDYQDELVRASQQHKIDTLRLIRQCIETEETSSPEFIRRRATRNELGRVEALILFEDCLYYQSDCLLADLNRYVDDLLPVLTARSAIPVEYITSINEVSNRRLPVAIASPLAIVLYELLENATQHAFNSDSGFNLVEVSLQWIGVKGGGSELVELRVEDNGCGLLESFDPHTAQSSGLAIVVEIARCLPAELKFTPSGGTRVTLTFPDPTHPA